MGTTQKTILYVDDDEDDVELLSDAIRKINPDINIAIAKNGVEALEYLHAMHKLPCLIVLDMNMPYLDGKQTFQKIRDNPPSQNVPVVVYTSSSNPSDKSLFDSLGIDFITKPHNFSLMSKVAQQIISKC